MTEWRVDPDADDAAGAAVLSTDRIWTAYGLADLEPPLRAHTRVALAALGDAPPSAALVILRHPDFTAIVPHGDPAGLSAILDTVELPDEAFLLVRQDQLAALTARYDFPEPHPMLRMAVDRARFRRPAEPLPVVDRLGAGDLLELYDLYADYESSAFTADMLGTGVFYGRRRGDRLIAAAGTHVVARRAELAAVGNVFVKPTMRGRGYGLAATARVVADLLAGPCRDVVLNVAVDNIPARRIYERLGFRAHCPYLEGPATLSSRASP